VKQQKGDFNAYLTLGYVFSKGLKHRTPDIEKALDYLEEGCDLGSNACCFFSRCCQR
jgi:hypothetical protein